MDASDLPASPDLAIPAVPAICDQCRQTGLLGEGRFSALPDILNFAPVPRRARADGWSDGHQRAFIAALAITGSPRQAARAIGKHQFGADQLRKARGGKAFAEAWEAALDLAREREAQRIHANIAELAEERDAELARLGRGGGPLDGGELVPIHPDCDYDPETCDPDYPEYWQAQRTIRARFTGARRILLACLANDPAKAAAWEVLCGPTDWDAARRFAAQADEPDHPNVHQPATQVLAEVGFLADVVGGDDKLAPIRGQLLGLDPPADQRAEGKPPRSLSGGEASRRLNDGEADASP